jgi:hypothetical protein
MLDKQDTFTRWYQGILGVLILIASVFFAALDIHDFFSATISYRDYFGTIAIGGFYLSFRCLWYAFSGEDNIIRDDS